MNLYPAKQSLNPYSVRLVIALIFSLSFSACTITQQDFLFQKLVNHKRSDVGTRVKQHKANGLQFTYLVREPKSSITNPPTLILLHGFSANKDNWLYFLEHLPDQYRIIAPDLAGHGDSDGDISLNYDLYLQAKRLHSLLTSLNAHRYHMIGNSMGGAITLIYQQLYPNTLQSMTLMNAAGVNGNTKSPFFKMLEGGYNPLIAYDKDSFNKRLEMVTHNSKGFPWFMENALVNREAKRKPLNQKIFADMIATQNRLNAEHFHENFIKLAKLKTPTLIMWGKEDQILDVSAVDALKTLIPHAEVEIYSNVGHVPMMEVPERSAKRIAEFVSKVKE